MITGLRVSGNHLISKLNVRNVYNVKFNKH